MSRIALNIEAVILDDLIDLIEQQNVAQAHEPGSPRVHVATTTEDLAEATRVLTKAFVASRDKAWLAWLRPADIRRVHAGEVDGAERKLGRVIRYLIDAAVREGGIVVLETAAATEEDAAAGRRMARGAALRTLPNITAPPSGWLHELIVGGRAALSAYGLRRTLAARSASDALQQATEAMRLREGIPERCIWGGMIGVLPEHEGKRVASRLFRPFHRLADRHGLCHLLQSSNPDRNDERVFKRFGFQHTGEFVYGASPMNGVGPYTVKFMVRWPGLS